MYIENGSVESFANQPILDESQNKIKVEAESKINNEAVQGKNYCRSAYDYYDLYDSSNPFVIKGNDIYYSLKNGLTNTSDLIKIGYNNSQIFNNYVPNYNPDNPNDTNTAINKLFENTPLKLGCCYRRSNNDNSEKSVVVRTPLNPYDTNAESDFKKFDFKFKTLSIPANSCPSNFYGDSLECNALYETYCKNVITHFNSKNLPLDDFKKYAPECACYAPKYKKEEIYPDNTPPACYKLGCENRNNIAAYVDPISRNNPCNQTICQNILSLENVTAGGDIKIDEKLENSCADYLPGNKSTNTKEVPDSAKINNKDGTTSGTTYGTTSGTTDGITSGTTSGTTGGTTGGTIDGTTSGTNQSFIIITIVVAIIIIILSIFSVIMFGRKKK
jgi:hypothetical protein